MSTFKTLARMLSDLATVATTGAYSDLSGKPTLGTAAALDVGTGNNNVVQLTAAGKYPAVDGSLITNVAGGFPSGTKLLFQQTAAPTGWTKDTTHNDKALRVVSGTASSGGTNAFSTVMGQTTVGSTTLTSSQIPAHTHPQDTNTVRHGGTAWATGGGDCTIQSGGGTTQSNTGGGSSHNHTITMSIQYVDVIIATKD